MTTPDGVQNVYTYDEQNRLLQTKAYVVGDTTEVYTYFGYDNNGNQIAKWMQTIGTTGAADSVTLSELGVNSNDDIALYEFDNFNRLVSIYQGDNTKPEAKSLGFSHFHNSNKSKR